MTPPSPKDDLPLLLGPDTPLTCEAVEAADPNGHAAYSPAGLAALDRSYAAFVQLREAGTPLYGTTTGFGPHVIRPSRGGGDGRHGAGLIAHLGAGWGPLADPAVVRAAMLLSGRRHWRRGAVVFAPQSPRRILPYTTLVLRPVSRLSGQLGQAAT